MKRERVLEALLREGGCTFGAELGVMTGRVIFHLLETFPNLRMIGVDKWECDEEYEDRDMPAIGRDVMERAKQYGDRATILHGDTVEMASQVDDASLDFIFIDAKHDYNSVLADIRAWTQKVKPDGFVAGHDINLDSVAEAVGLSFGRWRHLPDNVWLSEPNYYREWPEPEAGFDTC